MWTMPPLIPITNKDISYNRKIFLRTDSCFEHWALIQCPFDLEKNWYCWIWSHLETNHRNEDVQSAASELICELRRVCEYSSGPRYINRPVEIGMPKWGTCQTSEPTEVFSHESIEWMIFVSRTALKWENWNWKLCRLDKLKSWLESFSYHWPGETYKYWIQACPLLGEKKFVKLHHL